MLTLFAEIAYLQRGGMGERILGGQVPLLYVSRLDVLRIHVEGSAEGDTAAGKSLLRSAWAAPIARRRSNDVDVHGLDERSD